MGVLGRVFNETFMAPYEEHSWYGKGEESFEPGRSKRAIYSRRKVFYPWTLVLQGFKSGYTLKLYRGNKLVGTTTGLDKVGSEEMFEDVSQILREEKEE